MVSPPSTSPYDGEFYEEQHDFNVLQIRGDETDGGFFKCLKTGDYLTSLDPLNYV